MKCKRLKAYFIKLIDMYCLLFLLFHVFYCSSTIIKKCIQVDKEQLILLLIAAHLLVTHPRLGLNSQAYTLFKCVILYVLYDELRCIKV